MMPIYEYRCSQCGKISSRICSCEESFTPLACIECGAETERLFPIPHVPPDGMYSYAPNIGDSESFERKQTKIEERERIKRETGKVRLIDEV